VEYRASSNIGGFIFMIVNGHFIVSMVKSIIRVAAGAFLIGGDLVMAGGLLIAAELLGVLEEMV
jgi:hypothetical protein